MKDNCLHGGLLARPFSVATVTGLALLTMGVAQARPLDVGNPDFDIRWDNTIRYNLGARVEDRDSEIANNPNSDEGNFAFDQGDIVTNRLDLVSELDVIYKRDFGFRISAAAWYDAAYDDDVEQNPDLAAAGWQTSYSQDKYSDLTEDFYIGPYGEVLDAFVFGHFSAGDVPVSARAGRHTVFWGESLFTPLLGVSYAQSGLDLRKAQATPGAEAQELFLPLTQVSGTAQVTDRLSIMAQYFLEWEAARFPEGGTYLGSTDFILEGPDQLPVAPGFSIPRASAKEGKDSGNWGIGARYRSEILEGTVGVYYRKLDETLPWVEVAPDASFYRAVYAEDTELLGVSFTRQLAGTSLGAELIYRDNTAFNSVNVDPNTKEGARGDAYIGIINNIYYMGKTSLFDSAAIASEFTWVHWSDVNQNPELFNAEGFAGCTGDRDTGCATKNATALSLSVSPTWQQVIPSGDLTGILSYSQGLYGNGAVLGGGNEGAGSYSVGGELLYNNFHKFTAKYVDYLGDPENGGGLKDRGWFSLTYEMAL